MVPLPSLRSRRVALSQSLTPRRHPPFSHPGRPTDAVADTAPHGLGDPDDSITATVVIVPHRRRQRRRIHGGFSTGGLIIGQLFRSVRGLHGSKNHTLTPPRPTSQRSLVRRRINGTRRTPPACRRCAEDDRAGGSTGPIGVPLRTPSRCRPGRAGSPLRSMTRIASSEDWWADHRPPAVPVQHHSRRGRHRRRLRQSVSSSRAASPASPSVSGEMTSDSKATATPTILSPSRQRCLPGEHPAWVPADPFASTIDAASRPSSAA